MTLLKRNFFIPLFLLIACVSSGAAVVTQSPVRVAYDNETLTIAGTAAGFTTSKITPTTNPQNAAQVAVFTVNCSSGTTCILRFFVDGSVPTASAGMRALYGDTVSISGRDNVVNFKAIRETGTSVVLDVQYFR